MSTITINNKHRYRLLNIVELEFFETVELQIGVHITDRNDSTFVYSFKSNVSFRITKITSKEIGGK